ncbi:hypothetical protein OKW29_007093 [Paraburkholderia sp. CI3]
MNKGSSYQRAPEKEGHKPPIAAWLPHAKSNDSGLSGSPALRTVGALPPPCGRWFPCASIRVRRRARTVVSNRRLELAGKGLVVDWLSHFWASVAGARQARRATLAGSRWAAVERRPARRRCPRPCGVGSTAVHGRARDRRSHRHIDGSSAETFHCRNRTMAVASPSFGPCSLVISLRQVSSRTLVRNSCRTRGGLVCFSHNNDMRRHGWLWLKQTKPNPSGVEARSDSGVVLGRFLTLRNQHIRHR